MFEFSHALIVEERAPNVWLFLGLAIPSLRSSNFKEHKIYWNHVLLALKNQHLGF